MRIIRVLCTVIYMTGQFVLGFAQSGLPTEDIRVRDPFILVDKDCSIYYMYVQMGNRLTGEGQTKGVEVYVGNDLQNWEGPFSVFEVQEDQWAGDMVWAPEVHKYKDNYYLFVTLTKNEKIEQGPGRPDLVTRGTQVMVSESPMGHFVPFANKPHTPIDWMSLDGTLWVEDDIPYMIFCHEWVQEEDGTIELVQLADDLSDVIGDPVTLFRATDAPWVRDLREKASRYHGFVTDGPFIYKTRTDKLFMIWSSFGEERYAVGLAESESGTIKGPWEQLAEPLFKADGGHGMLFTSLDDRLMLVIHQPNGGNNERAKFFELVDTGEGLILIE